MFNILPPLCYMLIFINVHRNKNDIRSSILWSAVIFGLLIALLTEILSLFNLLSFTYLSAGWLTCIFILLINYFIRIKYDLRGRGNNRLFWPFSLSNFADQITYDPYPWMLLLGLSCIIAITGIIAVIAPPNTNDAMGYHMPRVMHWIQNHSVQHYPTNYAAQLFLSPWSAYAILNLQILSGGDRFANLVQWFSMVGSVIGVSLLAKQIGANPYGQILASVYCATLPMGILQASSTQNDYVVSFWLVCTIYYILVTLDERTKRTYFLKIGICLGLSTFTKPTAYLYLFPFVLWLFWSHIKDRSIGFWKNTAKLVIPYLLINLLHFMRNLLIFHNPLGTSPIYIRYTNHEMNITLLLSNIFKNISLHLSTPFPKLNVYLIDRWTWIHSLLNVDINDPRISSLNFQVNSLQTHEDLAGNPFHFLLICISIVVFIYSWRSKSYFRYKLLNYLLCLLAAFLLFCFTLAWTPFNSRLHLGLFVIASAFIGSIFSFENKSNLINNIAVFLIVFSTPYILFNENRPLIINSQLLTNNKLENVINLPRNDLYFMGRRYFKDPMIGAVNYIKSQSCTDIGVSFDRLDIYEYPLWILLMQNTNKVYRIEHVIVDNASNMLYSTEPYNKFVPCMIFDTYHKNADVIFIEDDKYIKTWSAPPITVFTKSS